MKKATFFIVCAALLIGCASYLLLVAQMPTIQPISTLKEATPNVLQPTFEFAMPVPPVPLVQVPVPKQPQPIANVGKFRIAIEYKLKNITPQSLSDFLEEQGQFHDIEMVNDDDADTILIKVSLDDHKIIQQMLVEIEREVEILRNNAAGSERLIKTFNVSPPSFGAIMPVFQSHCPSAIITPDNAKGLLIVVASESEMKRVEQFFEQIESAQKTVPTVRAQPLTPIDSPFLQ